MTEKEWEKHFPSHRIHAFVVKLAEGMYLSDASRGVEYTQAMIFRTKERAYEYANRYRGQVEIIDIDYRLTGLYQREPLD